MSTDLRAALERLRAVAMMAPDGIRAAMIAQRAMTCRSHRDVKSCDGTSSRTGTPNLH